MTEKNKAKIFSFSMPDAPKKQEKVTKITLPDVFASPMTKKPSTKELKLEVPIELMAKFLMIFGVVLSCICMGMSNSWKIYFYLAYYHQFYMTEAFVSFILLVGIKIDYPFFYLPYVILNAFFDAFVLIDGISLSVYFFGRIQHDGAVLSIGCGLISILSVLAVVYFLFYSNVLAVYRAYLECCVRKNKLSKRTTVTIVKT